MNWQAYHQIKKERKWWKQSYSNWTFANNNIWVLQPRIYICILFCNIKF